MRLPNQSAGMSRGFQPGARIRRRGVSPSLPRGGGLSATCSSDAGDTCVCPNRCCAGGPGGCACAACPKLPGGGGSTTAAFDF
jgi:hypothetical protein